MTRATALGLLLLLASSGSSRPWPPTEHRPPLDPVSGLVAAFGEYRPDHLHPGIDFSTAGRTGFPVFAVADGEIYRLKVEWRGYGRALYLRHRDGSISVYAHLESYEDRVLGLERRVERERRLKGTRYPGDIFLEPPLKVRRGARLGTSGESGAGLPHLHFEIRREDQEPMDPLRPEWFSGQNPPPVFEDLRLRSDSRETWINGARMVDVPLARRTDGTYAARTPLVVTGPFLPEARIRSEDGQGHSLGLKALSVWLDGRSVYRFRLESFRFSDYPKVGLILDHAWSRLSPPAYAYFLTRLPGNDLGRVESGDAFPAPVPGPHRLEVEAIGPLGHRSRALVEFRMVRPASLRLDPPLPGGVRWVLHFGLPRKELGEGSKATYSLIGNGEDLPCLNREELPQGEGCHFDIPPDARGVTARLLRAGGASEGTTSFLPLPERALPSPSLLRANPFCDFVDLHLQVAAGDPPPARLLLQSREHNVSLDLTEEAPGRFFAAIAAGAWLRGESLSLEWETVEGPRRVELPRAPGTMGADGTIHLEAGEGRLDLEAASLFSPVPLQGEAVEAPWPQEDGLRVLSHPVRFLPEGLPLSRKGVLSFSIPDGDPHPERLGIYRLDSLEGRWVYLGGEISGRRLVLPVGRFDTYALRLDAAPPRILRITPSDPRGVTNRVPTFRVDTEERGAGLNYDGVHLVLDGAELEMDFDPDRGWSLGRPRGPLSPGTHPGKAWAVDRAGNRSDDVAFSVTIR